jgi:hypothetical protein
MWTAPAFLDAYKAALLADVTLLALVPVPRVFTYSDGTLTDRSDTITFGRILGTQELAAMGQSSRDDSYICEGAIEVVRPTEQAEAIEVTVAEATTRATDILRRLIAIGLTRPSTGLAGAQTHRSLVTQTTLSRGTAEAGPSPVGVVVIEFEVDVTVRVTGA